jgi:hypothetical protein
LVKDDWLHLVHEIERIGVSTSWSNAYERSFVRNHTNALPMSCSVGVGRFSERAHRWEPWWDHQRPQNPQESSRHRHLTSVGPKRPSDPSSGANWKCGLGATPSRVRALSLSLSLSLSPPAPAALCNASS